MNILEYAVAKKMFSKGGGGGESGVPIKVATLPTPTAEDVGKVYLNTTDGEYYVGEASGGSWEVGNTLGNKIYFDTSVNPIDYVATNSNSIILACSDETDTNGLALQMQAMIMDDQYLIMIVAVLMSGDIHAFVYADTNMATIEEFNQAYGTSFTAYGWQIEELDTSLWAYCAIQINELSDYGNFAYSVPTLEFEKANANTITALQIQYNEANNLAVFLENNMTGLYLPDNVTLKDEMLVNYVNLVGVSLPTIANYKFYKLFGNAVGAIPASLKTVEIRSGETKLGAFRDCKNLKNVILGDAVTAIAQQTFSDTGLENITGGNGVTSIGTYAFMRSPLTTMNFPSVTTLNGGAIQSCHGLTSAIFPSVTTFNGLSIFQNCYSLTKVVIGTNQTTVTAGDSGTFLYCYHILGTVDETYNPTGAKDGYIYVPLSLVADYRVATYWDTYASQIMPYVATIEELANIDGTTYDKACVGDDYVEYTYNGTSWELYTRS